MLRHTKWSIGTLPRVLLAAAIDIGLAKPDQAWGQASVSVEADGTRQAGQFVVPVNNAHVLRLDDPSPDQIGSASCREIVWSYVYMSVVAVTIKHKHEQITHKL